MFGPEKPYKRPVDKVRATVVLTDGRTLEAFLFVPRGEELLDLLNDNRAFLPVDTLEGSQLILAKTTMAQIRGFAPEEFHKEPPPAAEDPYRILGVPAEAPDDVLRQAYLALVRRYHPDQWGGSGVPEALVDLARDRLKLVNAAYQEVAAFRRRRA